MNFPHARLRRALPVPLLRRLRAIHWQLCPPEPELALVSRFADPSRAFLDVGANTGVYLERALGRFAALYAVEPDPELAWYLERAFAGRVTVLALALSSRPGHMPFYLPHHAGQAIKTRGSLEADANPGLDQTVRTVPVATLDGLDLPPLGFVKIDVEGHELAVLEGGRERLRRDRPRLLIEIEERHHPGGFRPGFRAPRRARLRSLLPGRRSVEITRGDGSCRPAEHRPCQTLDGSSPPGSGLRQQLFFLHAEDTAARTALTRAVSEGDPSTGLSSGGRRRS